MKKIILSAIVLIYALSAIGQQVISNNNVSVSLPVSAQKITRDQALDHASKKFNNNKLVLGSYKDIDSQYIYKIDDVVLTLFVFDSTYNFEKNRVINLKRSLDEMFYGNKTYSSNIKKGNHNAAVIINYVAGNAEYYHFYCYNDNNSRSITGILEFDLTDANKAAGILNNLLASIKFKD